MAQLLCRNLTFECVWARERVCVCVYWTKEEALTITAHWLPILPAFSLTELKWIDTISAGVESGTAKTKETRSSNLEVADTVRTVITTLPKTQAPAALLLHSLSKCQPRHISKNKCPQCGCTVNIWFSLHAWRLLCKGHVYSSTGL